MLNRLVAKKIARDTGDKAQEYLGNLDSGKITFSCGSMDYPSVTTWVLACSKPKLLPILNKRIFETINAWAKEFNEEIGPESATRSPGGEWVISETMDGRR